MLKFLPIALITITTSINANLLLERCNQVAANGGPKKDCQKFYQDCFSRDSSGIVFRESSKHSIYKTKPACKSLNELFLFYVPPVETDCLVRWNNGIQVKRIEGCRSDLAEFSEGCRESNDGDSEACLNLKNLIMDLRVSYDDFCSQTI